MARGRRTSYTRDNRGRFASSPGGGAPKRSNPAMRRAATRAGNRLNRDNAGRISGIGRNGATVRGGRLKTAQGNRRATQLASMKPAGFRGSTIAKGGRGVRGMVARSLAAARKERAGQRLPAAQRPGSMTSTLRATMGALAKADARRIREIESITGGKVRPTAAGARAAGEAGARVRGAAKGGKVAATLRAGLRELAQSDARTAREMASIVRDATPKVAGAKGGKAIRGGRAALPAAKPAAAKQQPQKPSKKPANKAQRAYLAARSNARARGGDLRGADAGSRRIANSAAAVVKGMERRRSAAVPKAPADSPRAKQQQRQAARAQRAIRNQRAAMARVLDGPGSKASRSASVARRAQQIYAGKVDPKAKTKSRLTRTSNPEVLRKRIAKIKDNTARAAAKAATKAAKASAKPAKKESKRNISDAKAGRIIARLDANRPGLRKATGSDRRNRNLLQTYDRASKFVLAASTRESKRSGGQSRMDLAESVRRAVRNAKARAKPAATVKTRPKVTAKGARIGGKGKAINKYRYRSPATTMKYKEALPVSNANRPRRDRAMNVMQRSISGTVAFAEIQKLRIKAGVAANPYSSMSKGERTKAVSNLAKAELQNKKASRSYAIGSKADNIYTNLAGYTESGGKKWRRAGQRGTSLGAGTLRAGLILATTKKPATAQPSKRRSKARMWYESRRRR